MSERYIDSNDPPPSSGVIQSRDDRQPLSKVIRIEHTKDQPIEVVVTIKAETTSNRPREGLNWSDLVALVTIVGLAVYGFFSYSYLAFFERLGMSPEEVGISYTTILSKAGVATAYLLALTITMVGGLLLATDFSDQNVKRYALIAILMTLTALGLWALLEHAIGNSTAAGFFWRLAGLFTLWSILRGLHPFLIRFAESRTSMRRWKDALSVGVMLLGVLVSIQLLRPLVEILSWSAGRIIYLIAGATLLAVLVKVLSMLPTARRWSDLVLPLPWRALVPIVAMVTWGIFLASSNIGSDLANEVTNPEQERSFFRSSLVRPVRARPVCVSWTGQEAPKKLPLGHELVYIGQANDMMVFFDTELDRPVRISSQSIAVMKGSGAFRENGRAPLC